MPGLAQALESASQAGCLHQVGFDNMSGQEKWPAGLYSGVRHQVNESMPGVAATGKHELSLPT